MTYVVEDVTEGDLSLGFDGSDFVAV